MQVRRKSTSQSSVHKEFSSIWEAYGTGENEMERWQPSFKAGHAIGTHSASDVSVFLGHSGPFY